MQITDSSICFIDCFVKYWAKAADDCFGKTCIFLISAWFHVSHFGSNDFDIDVRGHLDMTAIGHHWCHHDFRAITYRIHNEFRQYPSCVGGGGAGSALVHCFANAGTAMNQRWPSNSIYPGQNSLEKSIWSFHRMCDWWFRSAFWSKKQIIFSYKNQCQSVNIILAYICVLIWFQLPPLPHSTTITDDFVLPG